MRPAHPTDGNTRGNVCTQVITTGPANATPGCRRAADMPPLMADNGPLPDLPMPFSMPGTSDNRGRPKPRLVRMTCHTAVGVSHLARTP